MASDEVEMHDIYCLQALIEPLKKVNHPLITDEVIQHLAVQISERVCHDPKKWQEYYPQPLDFVSGPDSMWLAAVGDVAANLAYFEDTLNEEGVWSPNFTWGEDTEASRLAMKAWTGLIAVKRAKRLNAFREGR